MCDRVVVDVSASSGSSQDGLFIASGNGVVSPAMLAVDVDTPAASFSADPEVCPHISGGERGAHGTDRRSCGSASSL